MPIRLTKDFGYFTEYIPHSSKYPRRFIKSNTHIKSKMKKATSRWLLLNLMIKNPVANNCLAKIAPVNQQQNQITTNLSDVVPFYLLF